MRARTIQDAINEAEILLRHTFDDLDPDQDRDCWFMCRLVKIMEALADRPETPGKPENSPN